MPDPRANLIAILAWAGCAAAGCSDAGDTTAADATATTAPDAAPPIDGRALASPGTAALMELMRQRDQLHYDQAVAAGVRFVPTADGASFYAAWTPPGFDPATDGTIVTLHGHGSWASSSFAAWRPFLTARRHAIVALQWWFGGGETNADYYLPAELYPTLRRALAEQGTAPGRSLFEGFSRGAANSYAVEAMDRADTAPAFLMAVANAGSARLDFPPNQEIVAGRYGSTPFRGAHWALFCGGLDPEPELSGCPAMERTRTWLESLGGAVERLIADPTTGHGGFHLNPANANLALDLYDAALR